jgi:hypothetical protein
MLDTLESGTNIGYCTAGADGGSVMEEVNR